MCCGYLQSGQTDIITNSLFLDGLGKLYKIENQAYVLRTMLIHCYMYYLAFRESDSCIDVSLQNRIKKMIMNAEVVKAVSNFYFHLSRSPMLLTENLEDKMEKILIKHELFPKHSDGKTMIMENIVKEYFLFVVLYVNRYRYQHKNSVLNEINTDKYYSYLYQDCQNQLTMHFADLIRLVEPGVHSKKEDIQSVNFLLSDFELALRDKYKQSLINSAAKAQQKYYEEKYEDEVKSNICDAIKEKFSEVFDLMNASVNKLEHYEKIHVSKRVRYTQGLYDKHQEGSTDDSIYNFAKWLIDVLKNEYNIKVINRDSYFDSDLEFRSYINDKKYDFLIGSKFVFNCENMDEFLEHQEFLKDKKVFFILYEGEGVATKTGNLLVKLDDVVVDITSPTMEDIDAQYNEKEDVVTYSLSSGLILDFKGKEFEDYIRNERKRIDIYFNVTIGLIEKSQGDVCTIFTRDCDDD